MYAIGDKVHTLSGTGLNDAWSDKVLIVTQVRTGSITGYREGDPSQSLGYIFDRECEPYVEQKPQPEEMNQLDRIERKLDKLLAYTHGVAMNPATGDFYDVSNYRYVLAADM